jgi:hypothetical protein
MWLSAELLVSYYLQARRLRCINEHQRRRRGKGHAGVLPPGEPADAGQAAEPGVTASLLAAPATVE